LTPAPRRPGAPAPRRALALRPAALARRSVAGDQL